MKIFSIKTKTILKGIIFITCLVLLILFCKVNFESVKETILTYTSITFPSLFPFILFVQVCLNTSVIYSLSNSLKIIPKIFNTSKNTSIIIFLSYLCGFPSGASMINKLYSNSEITKKDVDILSFFTNNCSPIFIFATVGIAIMGNVQIGIILFISHFLSSTIIGIIYSRLYNYIIHDKTAILNTLPKKTIVKSKKEENSSFFDILSKSIFSSFRICLNMLRIYDFF